MEIVRVMTFMFFLSSLIVFFLDTSESSVVQVIENIYPIVCQFQCNPSDAAMMKKQRKRAPPAMPYAAPKRIKSEEIPSSSSRMVGNKMQFSDEDDSDWDDVV